MNQEDRTLLIRDIGNGFQERLAVESKCDKMCLSVIGSSETICFYLGMGARLSESEMFREIKMATNSNIFISHPHN